MAVHIDSEKEILQHAREAEAAQDFDQAAELYEKEIKRYPLKAYAYDRLMIIYRKLKRYKDELQVVNKGIKAFEGYFTERSKKLITKNKQLTKISKALIKSTGLGENNHEYFPEPLGKWRKRKEIITKKLNHS